MVYIAEAHAMDEWPVSSGRFLPTDANQPFVKIDHQPTSAQDRCQLARDFCDTYKLAYESSDDSAVQMLVDDPETGDLFEKEYAPWPLRLYLIDASGCVEWIAQPKDCSYDLAVHELLQLLEL
jgi:hypothetical protein